MGPLKIAAAFAALKLLIHVATNRQYGYFRDELYFLACGEHLDWGYPDHAPMVAAVAWLSRALFGDSLSAIRFLPAVAGAGKVFLAGLIACQLGGGRWAVALACLCTLLAPIYLGIDTLLSMNAFEPLFWMGAIAVTIAMAQRKDPRLWLAAAALIGLGAENKHSMVLFAAALGLALTLSPHRWILRSRWFWAGNLLAALLVLPNIVWQIRNNWATLELLRNVAQSHKNVELGPLAFLGEQLMILLPVSALVWIAGLWYCVRRPDLRFLAVCYVALLAIMIALKGKNYYLAPIYPMLFAAGGVWWEKHRRLRWAVGGLITAMGLAIAPLALPLLPAEKYQAYASALGVTPPKTEVAHQGPLPQIFGDMFGWPEMVDAVARVYHGLPDHERRKAAIFAANYGEAGAIDFFGPGRGLPKAISAHQAYFLWGPRDATGEVLILLQSNKERAQTHCLSVAEAGRVGHPLAMREEHYTILVCRGLRAPLRQVWPTLKKWR